MSPLKLISALPVYNIVKKSTMEISCSLSKKLRVNFNMMFNEFFFNTKLSLMKTSGFMHKLFKELLMVKQVPFRWFVVIFLISMIYFAMPVMAEETEIPDGEILVIYSDGADEEALEAVLEFVAMLTYQSFKVSFGTASDCQEQLNRFSHIICYQLDNYPNDFLEKIHRLEEAKPETIAGRSKGYLHNILFVGNMGIQEYLEISGHTDFTTNQTKIGKLNYSFTELADKEELVEEPFFLFLKDNLDYTSGTMEVANATGYFCASKGNISHISVSDRSNRLIKAALQKEVALWKWPYNGEPHIYAQYIVLNHVYPYQDPNKLLETVNYLIDRREPFVIAVMPIYTNGTFPAMQKFCEILRYAQDNGGTVVMAAPIDQQISFDSELMNDYIQIALQIYLDQGVYPMALQVPENWIYNEETIEVMSHFSTIFTTAERDEQITVNLAANTNSIYQDGHHWISPAIALDDTGVSYTMVSSSAIYLDMTDDTKELKYKIDASLKSFVPLKSLWEMDHSFWTAEDIMTYSNDMILLNNESVDRNFRVAEIDPNYQYNRDIFNQFAKDFSSQNQKLIISVAVISFIFIGFILMSRYRNRQKFFLKNEINGPKNDQQDSIRKEQDDDNC
ncbi:DUF2334 domain-containing protein [Acetobacterium carbinolicum]|uniref:DUF2334 domain-containing protein n=1 Tax=Acetobacterium carbinolicum TaxID=52690 RepID=UPI0039C9F1A4